MRRQRALMAVVALAMWAGGCAHPRSCCPCSTAAGSAALNESLPAVERSTIVADTSAIGSLAEVDRALGRPTGGAPYYALTAGDCQCRAAAQSSLGNLLDGERRIVCSRQGHKMSAGDAVRLRALSAAAQEARNRSASQALQLYYSLAEVEVQLDLAQQGEDELAADMRRVREMRQQGLEVPFDDSDYTRRLAELRSRRIDAEVSRSRANHDLRRLLGMPSDDWTARLWPSTPLIVTVEPIDMQEAVSTALALSPELRGLRQLTGSADDQTLAAIGDVLQSVNGLLGTQADHCSILCGLAAKLHTSAAEVQLRRQQLYQYTLQREQEITEQVRNAASEVGERLRQIALAKEKADNWRQHIEALRAKSTTGQSTFVDIGAARLKSLDADGDVIHAIAAWEIARVKLAEIQGQLIAQCDAQGSCSGATCMLPAIRTAAAPGSVSPAPASAISRVAPITRQVLR